MIELSGIIVLGILAQWLAWRIKVPAILPLILIGLLVGPLSTYFTANGLKIIEPVYQEGTESGLFPGEYLYYFVSLSIGIILFEGGLTLKRKEIADVGPVILKLITFGSAITFIGAGLAAHFIMGLSWSISFLFAGLIIVTGPTVIAPILQNVPLNRNVATVLKWEGILIDPIGALVAVIVFEFIRSTEGSVAYTSHAFITFSQIIFIGLAVGAVAAIALYQLIKHDLIPNYLLNVFTLAFVLTVFVFSDIIAHESGLLSVVIMGMVLGNLNVPRLKDILDFKESLSVLLISILFILLAANIDVKEMELVLNNWRSFALLGFVALVLRPLGVFVSTRASELGFKEKLFISWVGPRGIVAAGIASLFGITLTRENVEGAEYITPLVFMIVLGTVLLNATTARMVAGWLKVIQDTSEGILIVGSSTASRVIGKYLQDNGRHVVLIDNNDFNVRKALDMGLKAYNLNIYSDDLSEQFDLVDMGYLVAMTSSPDVNEYAAKNYQRLFGENGTYRLISPEEMRKSPEKLPEQGIFSYTDDFINISEVARDYPLMHESPVSTYDEFMALLRRINAEPKSIPVFMKSKDGKLELIPANPEELTIEEGCKMVYLGKELEG
ncbi:MAG: sodium:proton antiporter [Saprospiraceae bacterium]|nr:sodium:proton antiporter [Lewinella sp.]